MLDAQVPASFSAPDARELRWDFGDGTDALVGPQVVHRYERSGRYKLKAFDGGQLAFEQQLEVVPRSIERALPASTVMALYMPALSGRLDRLVDFLDRLSGTEKAQRQLELAVLPALAMELQASEQSALDPAEGMGVFVLPGPEALIATLGVADEQKALAAAVRHLEHLGATALEHDGSTRRFGGPQGTASLFVDRGYLYLILLGPGEDGLALLERQIRASANEGLSANLAGFVGPEEGDLLQYMNLEKVPTDERPTQWLRSAMRFEEAAAELQGWLQLSGFGQMPAQRPPLETLKDAGKGPVAALSLLLPVEPIARQLLGAEGSDRRQQAAKDSAKAGVELEELIASLTGDLAAVAHFDAPAFFFNLIEGNTQPEPRGTVLVEAGLSRSEPWIKLVDSLAQDWPLLVKRRQEKQTVHYTGQLAGNKAELSIAPGGLRLSVGALSTKRETIDLPAALDRRFGGGAFGPGHSSLLIDLGQLRKELQLPRQLPGVDPRRLVHLQAFSSAFLSQLTSIDHLLIDLQPEATGAKFRARMVLEDRSSLAQ